MTLPYWSLSRKLGAGVLPRLVPSRLDALVEVGVVVAPPEPLRKLKSATTSTTSNARVITDKREAKRQLMVMCCPSCICDAWRLKHILYSARYIEFNALPGRLP